MGKINTNRRLQNIIGNIREHVSKKTWQCMAEGCCNNAINSHLLMRNGILNHLAVDHQLYELRSQSVYALKEHEFPFYFKKIGINQSISYLLFCNQHDTCLFRDIESGNVDYNNHQHITLYCSRAICAEIRKKEIEIENLLRQIDSSIIYELCGQEYINILKCQKELQQIGLRDLTYYKNQLVDEINSQREDFVYCVISLPIKGIYASTASSLFTDEYETMQKEKPLNIFFFHIIPTEEESILIMGYHKEHTNKKIINYIEEWKSVQIDRIGYMLTGLLTQVETWGMSPLLYDKLSKEKKNRYFEILRRSLDTIEQNPIEEFNLFEDVK